jgi:hypothetical protein
MSMSKVVACLSGLIVVVLPAAGPSASLQIPVAKVTIRVIDEEQSTVAGAQVKLGFRDRDTGRDAQAIGLTAADGTYTGEGAVDAAGLGSQITKDGFYEGWAPVFRFTKVDAEQHWLPWNENYTTVLRRVGKPIPMYAKRVWLTLPSVTRDCGFDLVAGDWVTPFGNGNTADLIFSYSGQFESMDSANISVTVKFSNPGDGIQEALLPAAWANSRYPWPRLAPEASYKPSLVSSFVHEKRNAAFQVSEGESKKYFFRIRTAASDGKTVGGLYGKIRGGLALGPNSSTTCKIFLFYYLNPVPGDRNLEYDPSANRFTGLRRDEQPREP